MPVPPPIPTIIPGKLLCGLFDTSFYDLGGKSVTAHQALPPGFEYVYGESSEGVVDVVIGTFGSGHRLSAVAHPRRIYWLQERSGLIPAGFLKEPEVDLGQFDLVLSNDKAVLDSCARARWLTLVGTWLPQSPAGSGTMPQSTAGPKPLNTSFIASAKFIAPGHKLRHEVSSVVSGMAALPREACYGELFGRRIPSKLEALAPYKFSIAIESDNYPWFYTEKLFDCFAARTIPLYWGPPTDKVEQLGFRRDGIITWHTISGLRDYIDLIHAHPDEWYEDRRAAVEHNYKRIREYYCTEVVMAGVIRDYFGFAR